MTERPCLKKPPALLATWRRRCQWLTTLLLLLTPWVQMNGNSLLRVDIPTLTLYCFGQTLRIEELYLVLLFSLAITLSFLLFTMLLGRIWCGWFCPQTTLTDLVEWFARQLGLQGRKGPAGNTFSKRLVLHAFYLTLAFLVASNLLWYFIAPLDFFTGLASLQLHSATWACLLTVTLAIYLDLALIRRLVCSEFCPYGRFQTVLADETTLSLNLPAAELQRCIKCNSCVRVCPMGIDIRDGYQVECINCGRCLDACRTIMAKQNQPGLIRYSFGHGIAAGRALFNLRTLLLSVAIMTLVALLFSALLQRPAASLKIAVSHTAPSRILKDGSRATFINAWINNRSNQSANYAVAARIADSGIALTLKGQTAGLEMHAGENRQVAFVLITAVLESRLDVEFILLDQNGLELAVSDAFIEE